jgi:putative protein kinase ArgK-like GTPase of G3E family
LGATRNSRERAGLTIVLTGPPGSGRTTVASIVAAALRDAGAEVTVVDDDPAARFGPLTGKKVRIEVRVTAQGAPTLRLVK